MPLLAALVAVMALAGCQSLPIGSATQATEPPAAASSQAPATAQQTARAPAPVPTQPRRDTMADEAARTGLPSLIPFLTGRAASEPLPEATPALPATAPPLPASASVRVGLLLPLSGANGELGRAMLEAAQMALFDFADAKFELLVHDTRGTPEGASEAARLAIGDGAEMILGPLLAGGVRAITPAARAANVPVIAFSSDRTVTGNGVYTMGFFPETEVERVIGYAAARGHTRIAALAPDNSYGVAVVNALKAEAARRGAVVTRVLFYNPRATDFSGVVQQISDYALRRQALEGQMAELSGRSDEVSVAALERLKNLQTLGEVPFDALMVADGGRRLQAIAALLPFYDVDPASVQILGTGQWDEEGLGAEPALLGGWFAAPGPTARKAFVARYEKTFSRTAPRLVTLAYDGLALAAVLARGTGFSRTALTQAGGFAGRDGIFRFSETGAVERGLAVLRVDRRAARVLDPAPKAFP